MEQMWFQIETIDATRYTRTHNEPNIVFFCAIPCSLKCDYQL